MSYQKVMNQKQMANFLGVSENTLKKLVSYGMPVKRLKNRREYRSEEVISWMMQYEIYGK
ncbi:hypothetical protein [Enterococcus cecorum]|uniref:hypothetical protein n=1 Tax=Enterococcus cecorum TaxID=44008 RepID=UPI002ACA6220|nr:hypothetical protein [Enterococcus cecorum]MDZ5589671.1 hypothetical protein [Enterococcus cecorum]